LLLPQSQITLGKPGKMHIGIVSQSPFPRSHDYRCVKIAATLARAGHNVTVFTPRVTDSMDSVVDLPGINALSVPGGSQNRLLHIFTSPWPFNPYWTAWLIQETRKRKIQCLLAKSLRVAASTWLAAKVCCIKFWLDLSENYPAMVAVERSGQLLLPLWKGVAAFLERFFAQRSDLITVVTESNRTRLIGLGAPADRLVIVSNTPELRSIPLRKGQPDDGKIHLVFTGLLSKVRGIDRLLAAIAKIDLPGERLHLHIIGDGPDLDRLRRLSPQLGLNECVTFHGWIARQDLEATVSQFDVGVISHLITEHTQTTVPNKLFDYMLSGVPVWATAMRPCQEIIEQVECGWVSGDDAESMAQTLKVILATPASERIAMGERGRMAVQERYNWGVDSRRMIKALENLEHHHKGGQC
jgi:glycosyltransferase involved in cell wall biosynthesis